MKKNGNVYWCLIKVSDASHFFSLKGMTSGGGVNDDVAMKGAGFLRGIAHVTPTALEYPVVCEKLLNEGGIIELDFALRSIFGRERS